jgi:exo-1,4-beta-D-glucosaminidase
VRNHPSLIGRVVLRCKTALRPLHVQYSYDDKTLAVVNTGLQEVSGLSVQVTVFNADGTQKANETRPVTAKANGSVRVGGLPQPSGLSTTYFTRLLLKDSSGNVIDRNVYWLSTQVDTLNYGGSDWYFTPQSGYADLTGNQVAFFLRASIRKGAGGAEVLPTDWSDNYVTLWPGETVTLTATYRTADLGGAAPSVDLSGHNITKRTIPAR